MIELPQKTVGAEYLAEVLKLNLETIKVNARRKPESLPPRLMIPSSKKLLWLESQVWEWIEGCSAKKKEEPPPAKRRGRPPKHSR